MNLAKAVERQKTAPIRETAVKGRWSRFKPMTLNEPVAKIARALKRTDGATRQKGKRHRLVAQLTAEASAKNG